MATAIARMSDAVVADLLRIAAFCVRTGGGDRRMRVMRDIDDALALLCVGPAMHSPFLGDPDARQIRTTMGYRLIYEFDENADVVTILVIAHVREDVLRLLAQRRGL